MSYLEHFDDRARADLHLITHTQEGCKCRGDGLHGARSDAEEEPGADSPSIRAAKKQRTEATNDEAMHSPSSCKSFYLLEAFVVSSSKYFRTLLETSVGGLETEMSTVGRSRPLAILHDYVEEGEMEAVELVLKSFYDKGEPPIDTLPSDIDIKIPLLLKALMLSERYQADTCKEKIADALSSILAYQLTLQLAKAVYLLPESILDLQEMNGIRSKIKKKPTPDQRDALVKEIRVINLGPAYFIHILPSLKWCKHSSLFQHYQFAQMLREYRGNIEDLNPTQEDLPASWLSAPRKVPGYTPPASTAFTLILREDQLKELYHVKHVYTEPVYHNGHWIKGFAYKYKSEGAEVCSLRCGLQVHDSKSHCLVPLSVTISIDQVGAEAEMKVFGTWLVDSDCGLGWRDFLDRECPTIQEVVAPYLVDGKLTINYEISKVDKAPKFKEESEDGSEDEDDSEPS